MKFLAIVTFFIVTFFGLFATTQAMANTTLSNDEMRASICIIANQGVHTAASDRQAGKSKSVAKKQLDKDLNKLSKSFSNPQFISNIGQVWYQGLDKVYQMPVFETKSQKQQFVSVVTQEAFLSCMDNFGK